MTCMQTDQFLKIFLEMSFSGVSDCRMECGPKICLNAHRNLQAHLLVYRVCCSIAVICLWCLLTGEGYHALEWKELMKICQEVGFAPPILVGVLPMVVTDKDIQKTLGKYMTRKLNRNLYMITICIDCYALCR